jgi:hypothetical protein
MPDKTKIDRLLELAKLMEEQERLLKSELTPHKEQTPEDLFYDDLQEINPYYTRYRYSEIIYK